MALASTSWEVELDLFRGPLHTLLELIERRELPVTSVSLVEVADQYLALVRASPSLDLDVTADFLHVAARLLLLKSQALLPQNTDDEPHDTDDEDDLEARLLAYRRYRDLARLLLARQATVGRMFGRVTAPGQHPPAPTRVGVEPARLRRAALRVMRRVAATERAQTAAPSPLVPFTQVLRLVAARLRGRQHTRLQDLVAEASDVIMAITMFLAVLELVRRRRVTLSQEGAFGPIELTGEWEHSDS